MACGVWRFFGRVLIVSFQVGSEVRHAVISVIANKLVSQTLTDSESHAEEIHCEAAPEDRTETRRTAGLDRG